jgi:Ca2+-binding RTX toxin-like protein
MLESLETRNMLSASFDPVSHTLTVNGTAGNDNIAVNYGIFGILSVVENGTTTFTGFASNIYHINIYGNAGDDYISAGSGGIGATLNGGAGNDQIYGSAGNDYIQGSDGNDFLCGGAGNDTLDGWYGNDYVLGEAGDDVLMGYYGCDTLCGGDGNDRIYGEADNDALFGGYGNDSLYGASGDDFLVGEAGYDYMSGGDGNDYFCAQDGQTDTLDGGAGYDTAEVDKKPWYAPWEAQDNYTNVENAFEP